MKAENKKRKRKKYNPKERRLTTKKIRKRKKVTVQSAITDYFEPKDQREHANIPSKINHKRKRRIDNNEDIYFGKDKRRLVKYNANF